jgi:hypothetical protein
MAELFNFMLDMDFTMQDLFDYTTWCNANGFALCEASLKQFIVTFNR